MGPSAVDIKLILQGDLYPSPDITIATNHYGMFEIIIIIIYLFNRSTVILQVPLFLLYLSLYSFWLF